MKPTMTSPTRAALKQTKPFSSPEHEVFIAIQRLASSLAQQVAERLRPAGLTGTQYNVLRVLRGAEPRGLPCGEVGERLITHDPDMTRLLDRMQAQGLVTRSRDEEDRRVVITRITPEGLELLAALDAPIADLHRAQLEHLGRDRLGQLLELLEAAIVPNTTRR